MRGSSLRFLAPLTLTGVVAALVATLACFPVAMLRANTRAPLRAAMVWDALVEGAKGALSVAMACACAGIIIGVVALIVALIFAAMRSDFGGLWIIVAGIVLAIAWTTVLRVGSQISLFLAPAAAAMSKAFGQPVRYNAVTPEQYRAFGFPGADDLGNMFQFKQEFNDAFCGPRNPAVARSLNPALQSFEAWLTQHKSRIPLT